MKRLSGKKYFYWMGQQAFRNMPKIIFVANARDWPLWALDAFIDGYHQEHVKYTIENGLT